MKPYQLEIKEHHLDSFGHVNNAVYLELYEEARWEHITLKGYGLKEIHTYKKGPVVLEAHIQFLKELKLRERITISFEAVETHKKICTVNQKIHKENGDLASTLMITIGFFDLEKRKLIDPTPEWLKALEA